MSIVGRKKTDGTKRSSVLLCILIAAAGIGLLAYLAPRAHPAAHWNVSCDGEQSQVRAREIPRNLRGPRRRSRGLGRHSHRNHRYQSRLSANPTLLPRVSQSRAEGANRRRPHCRGTLGFGRCEQLGVERISEIASHRRRAGPRAR
ncbi:exported hypothetical protein [Candidatus Sulfopaludibacter sp. SbA3]|nr:exported hypothetical protein [Candidatus Sulfopaludibacter sp. SbA3]